MRRMLAVTTVTVVAVLVAAGPADAVADTDPPRITFSPNPATPPPSPSGWYRDLSPIGTLPFVVDFADPAGLRAVGCSGLIEFSYGPPTLLGTTYGYSAGVAVDGAYSLTCSGTDQLGNVGVGPGSTPMPVTIHIDQTPPTVQCRRVPKVRVGRRVRVTASVADATSGPLSARVSAVFVAAHIGRFTAPVTGSDVAGNTTVASCPYVVVRPGHG